MDEHSMDSTTLISMILGGLLMGTFCGLAPLIAGNTRGYQNSGLAGMIVCIVSGAACGAFLALPVGLTWMTILLCKPRRDRSAGTPPPL